ncbi:DUF6247 family protein [Sporichthya sp.]|uniref:DUF6247 family protein n=1 Tax=Sporichthya sp. TaxID=65475 RepID=UPI00181B6388|nr:DUF6247 family protein [Sporichthya sp.]MBA3742588.1 hypothetical protein [Sporichthya sp.]
MTSAPMPEDASTSALPPLPMAGASPGEIRAALYPQYRDEFDRAYRAALDGAGRSMDLSGVLAVLESWRLRSWVTRDPAQHRHVIRRAAELLTGVMPPEDEPVEVTESRF